MSRPSIGQPAPLFELPVHEVSNDAGTPSIWSLAEHLGTGRGVVLIFHRHIH